MVFTHEHYIDGLVRNCSISIANALEILQSCTKPSNYHCTASLWYGAVQHIITCGIVMIKISMDQTWALKGNQQSLTKENKLTIPIDKRYSNHLSSIWNNQHSNTECSCSYIWQSDRNIDFMHTTRRCTLKLAMRYSMQINQQNEYQLTLHVLLIHWSRNKKLHAKDGLSVSNLHWKESMHVDFNFLKFYQYKAPQNSPIGLDVGFVYE